MKKIFFFLCAMVLVLGVVGISNATLIDMLNGVIQDDRGTATSNDDTYWIQDLNRFIGMTYDEQISAIEGLDNQGVSCITDFHMATYSDILSLLDLYGLDEIAAVFTSTPHPTEPIPMWRGRTTRFYAENIHYNYIIDLPPGEDYNGRFFPVRDDSPTFPGAWAVAYRLPCPDPEPTIDFILEFFDESVANGSLTGDGQGNSANGRLNALINMLEMAGDLIAIGDIEGACGQLKAASRKCDSESPPPDFVTGYAVTELYNMISELMKSIGCE